MYAEEELDEAICPWCIADGTAHRLFDAAFCDAAGIGGYGQWDAVPQAVTEEISYRTPGFAGWQEERWWTHCGDGACFLGAAGRSELAQFGAEAVEAIANASGLKEDDVEAYMNALDKDAGPTAYVFRCRHCGIFGGYSDMD